MLVIQPVQTITDSSGTITDLNAPCNHVKGSPIFFPVGAQPACSVLGAEEDKQGLGVGVLTSLGPSQ